MNIVRFILFFSLIATLSCKIRINESNTKVFGGEIDNKPWLVNIRGLNPETPGFAVGSGILLCRNVVLTIGHNIDEYARKNKMRITANPASDKLRLNLNGAKNLIAPQGDAKFIADLPFIFNLTNLKDQISKDADISLVNGAFPGWFERFVEKNRMDSVALLQVEWLPRYQANPKWLPTEVNANFETPQLTSFEIEPSPINSELFFSGFGGSGTKNIEARKKYVTALTIGYAKPIIGSAPISGILPAQLTLNEKKITAPIITTGFYLSEKDKPKNGKDIEENQKYFSSLIYGDSGGPIQTQRNSNQVYGLSFGVISTKDIDNAEAFDGFIDENRKDYQKSKERLEKMIAGYYLAYTQEIIDWIHFNSKKYCVNQ